MDIFEMAVMRYVTTDQSTLVVPQYDLNDSWASFDFLGIKEKSQRIYIIEVTSAANIKSLVSKVQEMFEQGKHIARLKQQLDAECPGRYEGWATLVAVFIRDGKREEFKRSLPDERKAQIPAFALEKCVFPWEYWGRVKDKGWDAVPD
jgi:hypothetical protein